METGAPAGEVWVGVHQIVDGLPMTGDLTLDGVVSWTGGEEVPAPRVELLVDGEVRDVTQSSEPVFRLRPGELGPGSHTLALRAVRPGQVARETPSQTIRVPDGAPFEARRSELRLAAHDERWRFGDPFASPALLAHPLRAVEATIALPDELEGRFQLRLDARGPGAPSHGAARVRVEGAGGERLDEHLDVQNWWNERPVGEVELAAGPKSLTLTLDPAPDGQDATELLFVRSVVLERVRGVDSTPPVARIVYPSSGHSTAGLDAVVVEAMDDVGLASVELLVDGRPAGSFARAPRGAGRLVLPFWSAGLAPGPHSLSVRVLDRATNEGVTQAVHVEVPHEPTEGDACVPGRFQRAVHLLDRLAYGPSAQDLGWLLTLGEEAWLERAFAGTVGDDVAHGLARAQLGGDLPYAARRLALSTALTTDNPVRSRFAFFLDNHFSTWAGKTGVPSEFGDHIRWQEVAHAPVRELLLAALTNPVLLVYLDQQQSFRGRLNENLARELLELHSVGVDGGEIRGYDQADVTALAGLLTGLTVSREAPLDGSGSYQRRELRFAPDLAVVDGADVMGMRFAPLGRDRSASGLARIEAIAAHLAAHPSTARFWARKLAESYVGVPAPADLVADLVKVYHESGGAPRALLGALASHPRFFGAIGEPRYATPFDFGLRFGRATTPRHLAGTVDEFMVAAGMGLFDHAAPDGYPVDDAAYIDSNALLARWGVAQRVSWAARVLAPEEVRRDLGEGRVEWQRRAIRHASFALLGRDLGEASMTAAMTFSDDLRGQPDWKCVDELTVMLTRLPEASFR